MESPVPFSPASSSDEMNSLFKRMLDNLFDGVYCTDLQRRITYWNQALDQQLFQQLDQHSKFGTPFGIILAHLDGLKNINDAYGHVAGDAALATIAKTLSGCLRASDVLGRWGGNEFLVILPGITKDILAGTSERCRALVSQSTEPVEGSQIRVTISVGATMGVAGDSAESLLNRADQRLYSSKQSGRNRVTL